MEYALFTREADRARTELTRFEGERGTLSADLETNQAALAGACNMPQLSVDAVGSLFSRSDALGECDKREEEWKASDERLRKLRNAKDALSRTLPSLENARSRAEQDLQELESLSKAEQEAAVSGSACMLCFPLCV